MKDDSVRLLRDQVEKVYRMNFYKRKLDQASISPWILKTLDDVAKVPFTSSSEFLEELRLRFSFRELGFDF